MNRSLPLALLLLACSDPPPPPPITTISYRFDWAEEGPRLPLDGLPLFVDGQPVGTMQFLSPVRADLPIGAPLVGPGAGEAPLVSPRLETEVSTNCGPSRVPLSIAALVPDPLWAGPGAPMNVTLTMASSLRSVLVYVDRRGAGSGTEVRVGNTVIATDTLPPGGPVSRAMVGIGSCPGADQIVIASEPPQTFTLPANATVVLVDPTGARCYERSLVTYVAEDLPVGGHDSTQRFDRAFVHAVGEIDFVLEPPPETISGSIAAVRHALAERRCR